MNKKLQRDSFRTGVLRRDGGCCAMCGFVPSSLEELDAHHIVDRNLMPFGGYVLPNGISLCTDRTPSSPDCHRKAESLNEKGIAVSGYTPADLYAKIKSSHWDAYHKSLKDCLDERSLAVAWRQFRDALAEELVVCVVLESESNETTWLLACENCGVNDPLILIYGKGRFYAADGGAERCNQANHGGTW